MLAVVAAPALAGSSSTHRTRVIVTLAPGRTLPTSLAPYAVGRLDNVGARILDVPDNALLSLRTQSGVPVHDDRTVFKQDFRTDISAGSFFANHDLGYTGNGITVAVLDSGVDASHADLRHRVVGFVDYVNGRTAPYDDNGHGTHVAGIIAGSGADSFGKQAGVAPGANIVALKVLDSTGLGKVSNVLAAVDWVLANANRYGIRVVNISFAAAVTSSYNEDDLTLAVKKLVDRGIIVVAAAGNHGTQNGHEVFEGIGSPANAPWVITVGASSSMGTLTRGDDTVADFSSRGPTPIDFAAKPDLVSGGVGIVSASAPGSAEYLANPQFLLTGSIPLPTLPYEVMTGTSMAAPSVAGTLALMLQADPRLTPNLAKAILEYTAQWNSQYRAIEQGAGFLNTLGAVRLAAYYGLPNRRGVAPPSESIWSRHINWGNRRVGGGVLTSGANAWSTSVTWGAQKTDDGDQNIIWGTDDGDQNIIWGTAFDGGDENIVWGTECGGDNCENIVWGTDDGDQNIIWGTDDGDQNIIWGTDDGDQNIIWGTDDGDENIIWGTDDGDQNIIWGTGLDENIIWGTFDGDPANIAWGVAADAAATANPSFIWFMSRRHDAQWVAREFGDASPLHTQGR